MSYQLRFCSLLTAALLLTACDGHEKSAQAAPAPVAPAAKGVVEPEGGLITVRTSRDGLVQRLLVQEGDHVTVGQPLAQLDEEQSALTEAASNAELGERRAQAAVAAARREGAEREARRLAGLAAADAATAQDADQAATLARVARGEADQASQAVRAAAARERLDAFEVGARTIRAPASGRIVRRMATAGSGASANAPLFVLEPDGRRIVRAELDETFVDEVRPGMAALITREFRQGPALHARVLRVADAFEGSALTDDPTARADVRVVSVVLALDDDHALKLGQRVLVRFTP